MNDKKKSFRREGNVHQLPDLTEIDFRQVW